MNDLVRQIQNLRKTSGLQMGEMATVKYKTDSDEVKSMIEKNIEVIKKSVSANAISFDELLNEKGFKLDDSDVQILVQK